MALATAASAQTQTLVKGKGSSPAAGFVSVNARGDVTNARGTFKGSGAFGDLGKGRVICVDLFFSVQANVGGELKRPVVFDGVTFTHFIFQVFDLAPGQSDSDLARIVPIPEGFWDSLAPDCGQSLWFDAFWQAIGESGDISFVRVSGDFVVSSRPARFDNEAEDDDA